jgi:hypothetical protein
MEAIGREVYIRVIEVEEGRMSMTVGAECQCSSGHRFNVTLHRTVWLEQPDKRDLVFSDKVNRFRCPKCGETVNTYFPFLATNVPKRVAVWYEPHPDPQIDKDTAAYKAQGGSKSFYALAPRIADWDEFKAKILELEQREGGGGEQSKFSPEFQKNMAGFIKSLGKKK